MKFSEQLRYIILSLFLICGCNTNGEEKQKGAVNQSSPVIIDLAKRGKDGEPLRLSQFADSISYIRLSGKFPDSEFFTNVKIIEDTIFLDFDDLYKYAPDGKFIKKVFDKRRFKNIRKLGCVAYNKKERYLTFNTVTSTRQINDYKNYSFDGTVLSGETKYHLENGSKIIETYLDDYCIYRIDPEVPEKGSKEKVNLLGPFLFYVENVSTGSVIFSYPNPGAKDSYQFSHKSGFNPENTNFINIDSTLWFKHFVIDTIYSTEDFVTIRPRYVFKTDKSFLSMQKYIQLRNGLISDEEVGRTSVIWGILPLPSGGLLISFNGFRDALADKNGNMTGYSMGNVINDIDEYLKDIELGTYITNRLFHIENNYLYVLVAAERFFKEGCKPPFDDYTKDSPPIILRIKLKT